MKIGNAETGDIAGHGATFAIIAARFNREIVNRLLNAAIETLKQNGVEEQSIEIVYVPGAFELPITALGLARSCKYSAIIALGCVIRGDTPHFDFVAGECARGIMSSGHLWRADDRYGRTSQSAFSKRRGKQGYRCRTMRVGNE